MEEIWKEINDFPNYKVSNTGKISSNRSGKTIILKGGIDRGGYQIVVLSNDTGKHTKKVHRLVAICYLNNPENLPEVNHKDGVKTNNSVDNLEWCTSSYNKKHAYLNGLVSNVGILNNNSKLTENNVLEIRELLKNKISQSKISILFGVSRGTIGDIHLRRIWKHIN